MLEIFANQHFLPTHPLRHHPLWLDENDFHNNHYIARANNRPHPFKIDPYAHHPQLSPYAVKGKRKSKTTKKERSPEEQASKDIITNTINMSRKHNREQNTSSSLSSNKNVSKEQYKIPICVGTVYPRIYYYNLEQMYVRVGFNNDNMNLNFNTLSTLQNINYYPQSFISQESNSFTEISKKDINDYTYTEGDDLNACKTLSAIEKASERRLERLKQDNMYSPLIEEGVKLLRSIYPTPSHFKGALSVLSGKRYSYELGLELEKAALKEGYRSPWWGTLKQWSKVGATVIPGEQSHDVPFRRNTKLVHISLLSNADEMLQSSFISASKGYLRYIYSFETNNLNVDSADLLNNLIKSSALTSNSSDDFIDDESNYTGIHNEQYKLEETQTLTSMRKKIFLKAIKQDIKEHNYKIPLYFSPKYILKHNLELREDAQGVNIEPFDIIRTFIDRDVNTTTSDDNNALLSRALTIEEHSDFDLKQSNMYEPRLAAEGHKDATNLSSSSSLTSNLQQEQIEEKKHKQIKDNKGNIILDRENNMLSHAHSNKLAQQAKPAVEVRHYYHLSQVRLPQTFMLPAEVLAAELSNPFVPLHGLTGQALNFNELQVDNLINTMPEVAAVISQRPHYTHFRGNSSHEMRTKHKNAPDNNVQDNTSVNISAVSASKTNNMNEFSPEEIDEFVTRNRSPTQHHGRHLWFTAKDILEHNGLVDVNATPVEVLVRTTHSTSETPDCLLEENKQKNDVSVADDRDDDQMDLMNRKTTPLFSHMYNVACLTHPEHALKLINNYFQEERVEFAEFLANREKSKLELSTQSK